MDPADSVRADCNKVQKKFLQKSSSFTKSHLFQNRSNVETVFKKPLYFSMFCSRPGPGMLADIAPLRLWLLEAALES